MLGMFQRPCVLLGLCSSLGGVGACGEDPPKFTSSQTLGGQEVSADVLNAGHRTYEMRCAACHGGDGSGQGPASTGLAAAPRDFRRADFKYKSTPEGALPSDEDMDIVLRNGKLDNGMPAFGGLTDADRHAVLQYIKTFSSRWTEQPTAKPEAS